MKKFIGIVAVCAALVVAPTGAFAHKKHHSGHHHKGVVVVGTGIAAGAVVAGPVGAVVGGVVGLFIVHHR